ncbi:hypothetical protein CCMA1212_002834 [Trichoderma ghanense]|uniref:Uncharacterized protein n=1 Tax=Trichoderma ghanense TaxID=65468 RepID=A0ABY2HCZ9_9HYPO
MEATLLSSLHTKLDDLEGKMRAYRCDLLSDFQRYYHDLLAGASPSVASSVQRAIVQSFANYPTLRPELEAAVADSQPPDPAAFHQPAARVEPPGTPTISSRDRETELQGLFTPSYLPLLDSSPPSKYDPRPVATSPGASTTAATASTTAAQTTAAVSLLPAMAPPAAGSGTATNHGITVSGPATARNDTPPADPQALTEAHHLVRTATEESTSSVNSDRSDAKARRSALRRSSSTSRPPQSPRRVRFDVMGTEVLPTSSPQQVEFLTPVASSPAMEDDSIASGMILGGDVDEWEPPVRKSSSTEALRALSRAPAEEGTVWTVVNPDTDEAPSHPNNTTRRMDLEKPISAEPNTSTADHHTSAIPLRAAQASNAASSYPDDINNHGSQNDDDDGNSSGDEDEFLAMPKRNSPAARKPASAPPQLPPKRAVNGHPAATSLPTRSSITSSNSSNHRERSNPPPLADETLGGDGYDDDDLFEFEPGGLSAPPKPRERPPPPPDDDDDDDDDDDELSDDSQDDVPDMDRPSQQPLYSTSPAVPIMRSARSENSTSTVSRFQPGSLGSYKGRPVVMPVVRNPEVHARAASLGNFNTFVGGLDGRSGMDEADLSSFRASFVRSGFSGTPRSFTERFMMEEAQAQAQAEREGNGSAQ